MMMTVFTEEKEIDTGTEEREIEMMIKEKEIEEIMKERIGIQKGETETQKDVIKKETAQEEVIMNPDLKMNPKLQGNF